MICLIYFREHKTTIHTQRTKVITMQCYYQRLIGLLIWSLTSSLKNRWQSSAEIVFYSISGCFEARWGVQSYRCRWCYQQLTTSFGIYTSLDSKLWACLSQHFRFVAFRRLKRPHTTRISIPGYLFKVYYAFYALTGEWVADRTWGDITVYF